MSGRFDVECFLERRRSQGAPSWGQPLTYGEETGSTNDDALAAARRGAPSGSVFLAEQQSAGRGRRGRRWLAQSGQSLLFSVLWRPTPEALAATGAPTPSAQTGALTLAVGLGVRAALAPHSEQPLSVKWPNDVLCARRKLAGILCESQLHGGRVDAIVIGIGINVAQQAFPAELRNDVTSLAELGGSPSREQLLLDLLTQVERRALVCEGTGLAALLDEFRAHDALRDRRVYVSGAREIAGIARGVDGEGHLLLETDGLVMAVHSGTVRLA
jgi:BirA family transcriptional regulator, biotin operon repressor / biotin---[acetyl-CoA-carboxylase] ligase